MDDQSTERPTGVPEEAEGTPPLGQRIFDNPFLLLILGILVMFIFFTGWGLVEIMGLADAPLP